MSLCPVCGTKIKSDASQCAKCGFSELFTEFVSQDDYHHWMKHTVEPCKRVYETLRKTQGEISARKYDNLKKAYQELGKKYDKLVHEASEKTTGKENTGNINQFGANRPGYGDTVIHKTFGKGKIVGHDWPMNHLKLLGNGTTESITVSFEKRFMVPDAFENGFLSFAEKKE